MTTRVNEKLTYGAIIGACNDNISGVVWYEPEIKPDPSASNSWGVVDVETSDTPSRGSDWFGDGRVKITISSRISAGSVYTARDIAYNLSDTFSLKTHNIVDNTQTVVGYARFDVARSRSLGESGGIINHYWEIDFFVNPV